MTTPTPVNPLNDRLDVYSAALGTVAECSPFTLVKYTLAAGTNVSLTANPSTGIVTVNVPLPGSVTSVGLTSSTLYVTPTPITSSGTLDVDLRTVGVTPGSYANANVTIDQYGRVVDASSGSLGNPLDGVSVGSYVLYGGDASFSLPQLTGYVGTWVTRGSFVWQHGSGTCGCTFSNGSWAVLLAQRIA